MGKLRDTWQLFCSAVDPRVAERGPAGKEQRQARSKIPVQEQHNLGSRPQ